MTISDTLPAPTLSYPVMTLEGFPHGLRCAKCHIEITEGRPFTDEVESVSEDGSSIHILICVYC